MVVALQMSPSTHKERVRTSLPQNEYTLKNLVAYTLYPPLYIAGPIMTFNDFSWQVRAIETVLLVSSCLTNPTARHKDPESNPAYNTKSPILRLSSLILSPHDGVCPPLYVRRSDKGYRILGRGLAGGAQHGRILELDRCLAQSESPLVLFKLSCRSSTAESQVLQLLIPWRFFRLWALADGMDPPENMVRCMANNYSCNGFWRSWHRSYNLWVVR
jgi:hypothetical protein